jgi:hypothetical protein
MTKELIHKSAGTALSQAEFEATDEHQIVDQATDDIVVATSASQLSGLNIPASRIVGKRSTGNVAALTPAEANVLLGPPLVARVYASDAPLKPSATDAANWIWVSAGDSNDEVVIRTALAALSSGGKLILSQGTFTCTGNIYLPAGIDLEIEGQGPSTILSFSVAGLVGAYNTSGLIIGSAAGAGYTNIGSLAIRNLKFLGVTGSSGALYGFLASWTDDDDGQTNGSITFDNVEAENCGLFISNVNTGLASVTNCYVHDLGTNCVSDSAISFRWCDAGAEAIGNHVHTTQNMGIYAIGTTGVRFVGNKVENTGLTTATGSGLDTNTCTNVTVIGNVITSKQGMFSEDDIGEIVISGNTFKTSTQTRWGIQVWENVDSVQSANVIVSHNTIDGYTRGIEFQDVINGLIQGNKISNIGQYGIELYQTLAEPRIIQVLDNEIYEHGQATEWQSAILANCDNVYVIGNYIDGNNNANCRGITGNNATQDGSRFENNTIVNCPASTFYQIGDRAVRRNNPGVPSPGDVITIKWMIDHASITDNLDATGYIDCSDTIPTLCRVLSVYRSIAEAFKDTVGSNTSVGVNLGDGSDVDRFDKTAATGDNLWNSTTAAAWDYSSFQGTVNTSATTTPRMIFTTNSDMTDLISGTGAQGKMTVYITYQKL